MMLRRGGYQLSLAAIVATVVAALIALLAACSGSGSSRAGSTAPSLSSAPSSDRGGLPAGTARYTMTVGGQQRSYLLHRPSILPEHTPVPLVVMMHGGGGSARGAEARYGWDPLADQDGFVVAYPDGIGHAWSGGAGCCGQAARLGVDDVGFITAMVGAIKSAVPIDPSRTYATGMSDGGIMSYHLACTTTVFAAIGPVSGTQMGACAEPKPISVIHIHGVADGRVPFDGHPGFGVNHITGGRSIPDVVAAWRAVDHCPAPTSTTAGSVHTVTAYCPRGHAVTLISVDGAGHQWPGSRPGTPRRPKAIPADPPSSALAATATIWTFFAAHPHTSH